MEKPTYTLIPMQAITDEARELAIKWVSGLANEPYAVWNAHKLASDIMNYTEGANQKLIAENEILKATIKKLRDAN